METVAYDKMSKKEACHKLRGALTVLQMEQQHPCLSKQELTALYRKTGALCDRLDVIEAQEGGTND